MEERGLMICRKKTEYLGRNEHHETEVNLQGDIVIRVNTFTYMGSTLAEDGELNGEATRRVQGECENWKIMSGVLCDRRMDVKIKGKVRTYRTVRPALIWGQKHGRRRWHRKIN